MKRILIAALFLSTLMVGSHVGRSQAEEGRSVEETIDSLMAAYDEAKGDSAKLAVCLDILKKYPESRYTYYLLRTAQDHSAALGRTDEFTSFAEKIDSRVSDPEIKADVGRILAGLYAERGEVDKLEKVASRLAAGPVRKFSIFYDLIQAYAEVGMWRKVLDYAGEAEEFANAEAYRREYPTAKLSQEELEKRGRNRKGLILSYTGWAKANTGRIQEALSDYKAADKFMERAYMGYSNWELDYFWGETLAKAGRFEEAIDRLARKALFGEDEDARKALHEAYTKLKGSDAGFDDYLWKLRTELARPIEDFTLEGYDGSRLTLSSFKGKVVLLAFWFPT